MTWIKENWKAFARVAVLVAIYVFIQRYPLTAEQRDDFMIFVVATGMWAGLSPGVRAARREDDPK